MTSVARASAMNKIVLFSLVTVAAFFCNPLNTSAQPSSQTKVTTRAPDAFYNPPPNVPRKSGVLLRVGGTGCGGLLASQTRRV
jgi:hypothetical protein